MPVVTPTDATELLLLLHVPLPLLVHVVVEPAQITAVPVIAVGSGFTVATVAAAHPVVVIV